MRFTELHLIEPLLRAVHEEGYVTPTPIQEQSIPHVLSGKDLLGCAQTGTGKTAAFALPILQRLHAQPVPHVRPIRVLVLAPTRELATQIGDSFRAYGRHLPFRHTVIYGGVGQNPQVQALRHGVDIVVATPGRLLDLMQQGFVKLGHVEVLVLDEADRMLDMGFIHDVRRIVSAVPRKRQTLFFSATMPRDIQQLAHDILVHPVRVEVTPTATTVEKIAQSICFVDKGEKFTLLQKLLRDPAIERALVFTRTKHGANKLARQLEKVGVRSDAIHGNKAQTARERALKDFSKGRVRVLVATDIAARGIDVEGITHVFNYDLPNVPDSYVHRIGRTARAGASGAAIAFCSPEERGELSDIEKLIRMRIPVMAGYEGRRSHAPQGHAHAPAGSQGHAPGHGRAHGHAHGSAHGHAPAHPPQHAHGGGHGHVQAPAHPPRAAHGQAHGHAHPPAHPARPAHGGAHGGGHGHAAHPPAHRPLAGRLRGRHRKGR